MSRLSLYSQAMRQIASLCDVDLSDRELKLLKSGLLAVFADVRSLPRLDIGETAPAMVFVPWGIQDSSSLTT